MLEKVHSSAIINNPAGLHARPSVKLSTLAKTFMSDVALSTVDDGVGWIDAKSVSSVMGLKIPAGKRIAIRAVGDDAKRAVDAILDLVERRFEE